LPQQVANPAVPAAASATTITSGEKNAADSTEEAYVNYNVVVVDTGQTYSVLRAKMLRLSRQLRIPVDTLGRTYNKKKKLIALPDNDADDIYAGDYFPRRTPSQFLSLEYLSLYKSPAGEKTMALVAGIYVHKASADSMLLALLPLEKQAFQAKASIYVGCMH